MKFCVSSITYWSFLCNLLTTVASYTLSVTQLVHQGETGGAVTLEWLINAPTHISPESVTFNCVCAKPKPGKIFCVNDKYIKYPEHQGEQFRGRVSWEREALQNGTLRFHLSNLTTQDSGTYHCIVALGDEEEDAFTILNVTDQGRHTNGPKTEIKIQDLVPPPPALQSGWYGLLGALCLLVLGVPAAVTLTCLYLKRRRCHHQEEQAIAEHHDKGQTDPKRFENINV